MRHGRELRQPALEVLSEKKEIDKGRAIGEMKSLEDLNLEIN